MHAAHKLKNKRCWRWTITGPRELQLQQRWQKTATISHSRSQFHWARLCTNFCWMTCWDIEKQLKWHVQSVISGWWKILTNWCNWQTSIRCSWSFSWRCLSNLTMKHHAVLCLKLTEQTNLEMLDDLLDTCLHNVLCRHTKTNMTAHICLHTDNFTYLNSNSQLFILI